MQSRSALAKTTPRSRLNEILEEENVSYRNGIYASCDLVGDETCGFSTPHDKSQVTRSIA